MELRHESKFQMYQPIHNLPPCWLWALVSNRKEKVVDTSSRSKVPLESFRAGWRSHTKEQSELVHLVRMYPGLLHLEVFWSSPTGPKVDSGLAGGIKYPVRPGDTLGSTRRSWKVLLVRRTSDTLWWACCRGSTISDNRMKMAGWMDEEWLAEPTTLNPGGAPVSKFGVGERSTKAFKRGETNPPWCLGNLYLEWQ